MNNSNLVEIHIPCYNENKSIINTLLSIKDQSYKNFVVFIHDNCSTDGTSDLIKEFCQSNEKFFLNLIPHNTGAVDQIQRIKFSSRSEYILLVSANDILEPTYIGKLLDLMLKDNSIGLAYSYGKLLDTSSNKIYDAPEDFRIDTRGKTLIEGYLETIQKYTYSFPIWGMYRRIALEKIRPYQYCFGGDHILVAEIALHYRVASIHEKSHILTIDSALEIEKISKNIDLQQESFARGINQNSFFFVTRA